MIVFLYAIAGACLLAVIALAAAHAARLRTWKYVRYMPGPDETLPLRTVLQLQLRMALSKDRMPVTAVIMKTRWDLSQQYRKEGFFCFYIGTRPCITVYKADHVEAILNNRNTESKSSSYSLLHSWLGTGLLTSNGAKWKSRRRMLTPAFHFKILEDFVAPMNRIARRTASKIGEMLDEPWIDVVPLAASCTLDVLLETVMGVSTASRDQDCTNYVRNVKAVAWSVVKRSQTPWLLVDWLYNRTEEGRQYHEHVSQIHAFTQKVIAKRRGELIEKINAENKEKDGGKKDEDDCVMGTWTSRKRLAFIDILLRYSIEVDSSLTDDDIREETDTFMFEGHDTTSMGISWSLYLIALHTDVQAKIQQELDSVLTEDLRSDITMETLKELKYLDRVLKECQRVYPPVPVIGRAVTGNTEIGGYTAPEDSDIDIFIYALHRDPEVFPDPEVFNPDRFLPEDSSRRNPYAYVPFSAGPRNCIGQRFASMEVKIIIATILRQYQLRAIDQRDQLVLACELILRPLNGLRIAFSPRSYHE